VVFQEIPRFYGTRKFITVLSQPANGSYPEPNKFSQQPVMLFKTHFNILSSCLCLYLPSGLFPSESPTKIFYALLFFHMRFIFLANLTFDLIVLILTSIEYFKLLSNFPQPPITSSLLGENILLYPVQVVDCTIAGYGE
jgi:hypothetical protein